MSLSLTRTVTDRSRLRSRSWGWGGWGGGRNQTTRNRIQSARRRASEFGFGYFTNPFDTDESVSKPYIGGSDAFSVSRTSAIHRRHATLGTGRSYSPGYRSSATPSSAAQLYSDGAASKSALGAAKSPGWERILTLAAIAAGILYLARR